MAQPNVPGLALSLANAGQNLSDAAGQIALIPNMPIFDIRAELRDIGDQLTEIAQDQQQLRDQIQDGKIQAEQNKQDIERQLTDMEGRITRRIDQLGIMLPIRLQNASSSLTTPLVYPPGVNLNNVPKVKHELLSMTVPECTRVAQILNLPALNNPSVLQQRQQIIHFLGANMEAR